MAWDHLSINKPHLVYLILGGFTSLFMLCSSFIKERMYIGEATVATLCGVMFGPHAANLIDPLSWGNTDQITLEFSRIVLVVQCFAVGVELPKYYMEKHWRSVVFLLVPVMTYGWLMASLFVWWMVPGLDWLESLCVAACVTATDPVLASSVVGKGKFAKRVPKHLRDLLSAESGCNDGMAFPFIYLALYALHYRSQPGMVAFNWIVVTILYECIFGAIYGFTIGYIGRHGIKYAESRDLVDRESFLVFYFVLALFCAGSGSLLGVDDLLVGFAAGVGFSNDGWFTQKTEESHVSNVIDLLLNLAYFVYLGTIIPWEQYNSVDLGLSPWRLVVIALFVVLFRRIPIMMVLKPLIPDIKTWREALFAGHFGPIGVGAIFVAILARADLETGGTVPLAELPGAENEHYLLIKLIWPITTFLVVTSILVHGSSIAVFTLGKHINTLTLTMSYTMANEDGPSWMNRLPRISSQSKSMTKQSDTETEQEQIPPGNLPPVGMSGTFLRRQKEEDNPSRQGSRASSLVPRRRKKKWDSFGPGGPVSQSAITPQRRTNSENTSATLSPENSEPPSNDGNEEKDENELGDVQDDLEMHQMLHPHEREEEKDLHMSKAEQHPDETETYLEGHDLITENEDGDVLAIQRTPHSDDDGAQDPVGTAGDESMTGAMQKGHGYRNLKKKLGGWKHKGSATADDTESSRKGKRGPALAYQFGNTIIVEDAEGEVVKKYELPSNKDNKKADGEPGSLRHGIARISTWTGKKHEEGETAEQSSARRPSLMRMGTWTSFGGKREDNAEATTSDALRRSRRTQEEDEDDDDRRIRFTIAGAGQRMTKDDFLKEIRALDPKSRSEIIEESDAPTEMKDLAKKDASSTVPGSNRLLVAKSPQFGSSRQDAKQVGANMAKDRGAGISNDEIQKEDPRNKAVATNILDTAMKSVPQGKAAASEMAPLKGGAPTALRPTSKTNTPSLQMPETAAERRRREEVLKGLDEVQHGSSSRQEQAPRETPAERRRREAASILGQTYHPENSGNSGETSPVVETAAEKRRREAALGFGGADEDSDDDNTERVPQARRSRGIRFAEEPVRGRK